MSDFVASPLEAFHSEVRLCTRDSRFHAQPAPFLLIDTLRKWLQERITLNGDSHSTTRAGYLLESVLAAQEPYNGAFRDYGHLLETNQHFLDLFVILLQTNVGRENKVLAPILEKLRSHYLGISVLSMLRDAKLYEFIKQTGHLGTTDCDLFVEEFRRTALQMIADSSIKPNHEYELEDGMIMPLTDVAPLGQGGQSDVFRVTVPAQALPYGVLDRLRNQLIPSHYDEAHVQCYELALKKVQHEEDWKREVDFHRAAPDTKGIVQCFASWKVRNRQSAFDYYVLLELGWWDLEHFFQTFVPPTLPDSIMMFWLNFRNIIETLSHIHKMEIQSPAGKKTYYGWHGDIKLSNILICPAMDGDEIIEIIKLTDPGFAKFQVTEDAQHDSRSEPIIQLKGGTEVYGGPERYDAINRKTNTDMLVTRGFDIWSLGCAVYEAATWVILGQSGFNQFKLLRKIKGQTTNSMHYTEIQGDEEFHENGRLSEVVGEWHQHLLHCLRKDDTLSGELLEIARKFMLQTYPHKRESAVHLTGHFDAAIEAASARNQSHPSELTEGVSEAFRLYRQQLDQEADESKKTSSAKPTSNFSTRYGTTTALQSIPFREQVGLSERHRPTLPTIPQLRQETIPGHLVKPRYSRAPAIRTDLPASTEVTQAVGDEQPHFGYWLAVKFLTERGWQHITTISFPGTAKTNTTSSHKASLMPTNKGRQAEEGSKSPRLFGSFRRKSSSPIPGRANPHALTRTALSQAWTRFGPRKDNNNNLSQSQTNVAQHNPRQEMFTDYFRDRDIIMLFDNTESMSPYWSHVQAVACVLMALLWNQDETGVDLYFSSSRDKPSSRRSQPIHIQEDLMKESPGSGNREGLQFDGIYRTLRQITQIIEEGKEYTNKVTLIIFTDGNWNDADKRAVEEIITRWLNLANIQGHNINDERRYTVQFIHFGDNVKGYEALESLDDDLCRKLNIPDVIDVERADGNVLKMIMGSLDESWDALKTPEPPKATQSASSVPRLSTLQKNAQDQPSDAQFLAKNRNRTTGHDHGASSLQLESQVPARTRPTERGSTFEHRSTATWGSINQQTGSNAADSSQPRRLPRSNTNIQQPDDKSPMQNMAGWPRDRDSWRS